ncbi:MAG: sensor histidine kinase [Enterocloster sp.]
MTFCLDVRKSFMDEDVMIPPLTIQPLVENSIQHGLKDRVNGGKVDILITEKPDYIEVAVVSGQRCGFSGGSELAGPQGYAYPQNFHRPEKCGGTVKAVLPERGCAAYPADGGNYIKDFR